jgi:NhaA family Na+:H+ antiporter
LRSRPAALLSVAVKYSLFLPAGAAIALVWANTAHASYARFARALEFPVNDIGMVFFFALAAKEVVEAMSPGGALHTWRRAALPVIAAVGGMAAPAGLYVIYVVGANQPELLRGWAIPCATDIAFSYLVATAVFGRHAAVPFLLLLAIADDALGLVILALFFPVGGLHPALALVPIVPFFPRATRDRGLFVDAPPEAHDTLTRFERWWRLPVQGVLFLFGLANAGVQFTAYGTATSAVLIAILAGKPIGIGVAVALATAAGFRLPADFGWREVVVVGCAAGIGFTVALFFATAAFPPGRHLDEAKLGALLSVGSAALTLAAAAVLGVGVFRASGGGRP